MRPNHWRRLELPCHRLRKTERWRRRVPSWSPRQMQS
jgi:hypothetical protein